MKKKKAMNYVMSVAEKRQATRHESKVVCPMSHTVDLLPYNYPCRKAIFFTLNMWHLPVAGVLQNIE